ncbi:hypothetical protein PPYR_10999 [Photinus pyralis]|uniref:Reverse transcriptase domain-containing protein n=1 Tax=Photinus pyralis TaxID=7054 RepID=A0A5N4AI94_PHOPY|nr:hypothetical protein PPYR_10999 [Photinus pyralis]
MSDMVIDMNKTMRSVHNHLDDIKLILNKSKTCFMQFYTKQSKYRESALFKTGEKSIEHVSAFKLLGCYIDMSLNWKDHIAYLCKKIAPNCFALKRLSHITNKDVCKTYYYAHIASLLSYAVIFWGNSSNVGRVFIVQKRIIRCMFNIPFRDTCRTTFVTEKILTLPCIYVLEVLKFVRLNTHKFCHLNQNHSYHTRKGFDLKYPNHKLALFELNPFYMGITLFNKLPPAVRQLPYHKFVKTIKQILALKAYYSLEEFISDNLGIK